MSHGRKADLEFGVSDSDETLALSAAKGDKVAYEKLLRAQYDRIFSLTWRLTGNFHEAQDVTQDICLSLPRRLQGFRGEASLKSWLYRVVVNAVHDARRAAGRRARWSQEWGAWELDRIDDAESSDKAHAWLNEAIASLPVDLRDTLALSFDDDLTQAQIATILDISPGTVAWRISQLKKHLRQYAKTEGVA